MLTQRQSLLTRELRKWSGRFMAGPLLGIVACLLVSGFLYAPRATDSDSDFDKVFDGKSRAARQRSAVIASMPIGALAGLATVSVWWLVDWNRRALD